MISVKEDRITLNGSKLTLGTELAIIVHSLITENVFDREEIMEFVTSGLKTESELKEEEAKLMKEAESKLKKLADLFSGEDESQNAQDTLEAFHRIFGDLKD